MSYTLSLSNGTALISNGLQDGTIDNTSTSLSLIGKNYPGYGKLLNENFIQLLENFANSTAPSSALPGQLWWDSSNKVLKVNSATTEGQDAVWRTMASIVNANTLANAMATSTPLVGDLWWDTANQQLKIYSGVLTVGESGWVTIGPVSNTTTGQSGAVPDTIVDTLSIPHVVIKFYISNDVYAILSKDSSEWTPLTPISGFSTIKQGLNLFSGVGGTDYRFYGNSNVAYNLMVNGTPVPAGNFSRNDVPTTSVVPIVTTNNGGISFGTNGNLVANISDVTGAVGIYTTISNKDIGFYANVNGVLDTGTPLLKINSSVGIVEVSTDPSSSTGVYPNQVATKNYTDNRVNTYALFQDGSKVATGNIDLAAGVSIVPKSNAQSTLGNAVSWFSTIYGVSIQAKYADLAERFESDVAYSAGTVVELGGAAEITAVKDDLSDTVFGVISSQAAYLMNAGVGSDETHPAVAVSGRVPVNVIGKIRKGDRLVSAGNGMARAADKMELTPWNVIGRALENKLDDGVGVIEAIVKLNS